MKLMEMPSGLSVAIVTVVVVLAGCGDVPGMQATSKQSKAPARRNSEPTKPVPTAKSGKPSNPKPVNIPQKKRTGPVEQADGGYRPAARAVGRAEELALTKVATIIKESLEVGPTAVIWIIDRTRSAQEIVAEISTAAQNYYESPEVRELSTSAGSPLVTAIVAFDEGTEIIVDPPTRDWQKLKAGFDAIKPSSASRENPFTAVKQALEKYLPLRSEQRRELVLIVVTDEAGDDGAVVEELIEPLRRHAISLYAIGLPAPWGQVNPFSPNPKAMNASNDDSIPTIGPESRMSERVDVDNWKAHRTSGVNIDLVDSGFGPFALERLCRASRGQFFALRPELGYGYRGASARAWPPGGELRFEDKVVNKYAPDYVSEAEYRKLLAENKARAVLCEAAKLPLVAIEGSPTLRFPKGVEAKMAKQMTAAQQFAARNLPPIVQLHELLMPGEEARAALKGSRWQAEFDLAVGRVLANRARLDGYNSMIAALKRGKAFQKPDSKAWLLESADNYETESTIKKMADKAKMYLDRVIQEHPGTPWAKIAEEELRTPLGWQWKEA
jgi:hypothetical protein